MNIRDNPFMMVQKCVCEGCNNKKILKHFEKCKKCGSEAFHSTPWQLNPVEKPTKEEIEKPKETRRQRW